MNCANKQMLPLAMIDLWFKDFGSCHLCVWVRSGDELMTWWVTQTHKTAAVSTNPECVSVVGHSAKFHQQWTLWMECECDSVRKCNLTQSEDLIQLKSISVCIVRHHVMLDLVLDSLLLHMCQRWPVGLLMATVMSHPLPLDVPPSVIHSTLI